MKRGIKSILLASLLILSVMGRKTQQAYASDQSSVRVAESGDQDNVGGKGDVDVSGEMKKDAVDIKTSTTTYYQTSTGTTQKIGGKVIDTTGKNIKTGDVLTSAKTLTVLFLGVGCLFLIMGKRKQQS